MDRLDFYEIKPAGMERYLSAYGWHFSKAMCMWAISMMKDRNGAKVQPMTREQLKELFSKNSMNLPEARGYDDLYLAASIKADYWGSSINTEPQMCKMIVDMMNDKDGYDGMAFTRFYADTIAKGYPIMWEEMM
ncbi:MAG: hypothetical protein MJZ98_07320 [Paludibacteraceae bacterium]|nr:hypothetical protein [Paludibacteraceae bacterium]